jgi:hypothetical protein
VVPARLVGGEYTKVWDCPYTPEFIALNLSCWKGCHRKDGRLAHEAGVLWVHADGKGDAQTRTTLSSQIQI